MSGRSRGAVETRGTGILALCHNGARIRPFGRLWGVGYRLVHGSVEGGAA
jgi:hypothetical protein